MQENFHCIYWKIFIITQKSFDNTLRVLKNNKKDMSKILLLNLIREVNCTCKNLAVSAYRSETSA